MARKGSPGSPVWKIFILWVLVNFSIAFLPLSLTAKIILGTLFLAVPFLWLMRSVPLPGSAAQKLLRADFLPEPSGKVLLVVLFFGALLRLWGLTSLSAWPTSDEGWMSFITLGLFKQWRWNLLLSAYQIPPFHFWGQALLFRCLGPSLSSLWLFPALVSILNLGLGYWATRAFFTPRFSLLCLLLGTLNYWFLWSGRLCVATADAVLPFELLAFGFFGRALGSGAAGKSRSAILLWGLASGLCLYTAVEGAFMTAAMGLTAAWIGWKTPSLRKKIWLGFGAGLCVVAPLVLYGCVYRYGSYVGSLWFTKDSGYYENHWMAPLSHFTALFWGARDWTFWGGLLNPLEASLAFLGMVFCLKDGAPPWNRWLPAAFVFFMLPGLLTNNFDPFRVVLEAPLLPVFTALGWGWVLSVWPKGWIGQGPATAGMLILCAALNLYHLAGPYHQAWGVQGPSSSRFKDIESWRAFEELDQTQGAQGPGLVFQDFNLHADQSLRVAVYPFNAQDNPALAAGQARWVALLANAQYTPFLQRRFPDGRWVWLSDHLPLTYGGVELGVIPVSPQNAALWSRWAKADSALQEVNGILTGFLDPDSESRALEALQSRRADFEGDPFLESVFWDKMQFLSAKRGDGAAAVEALRQAVRKGYPVPYFYQWMADDLRKDHQDQAAEEAYRKARELAAHPTN